MVYLARLRLGRGVLALTMLYTLDERVRSSGRTIQLSPVISAAQVRLRRVIIALTLVHTVVQRVFSSGPTQLGSVLAAAGL